MARPKANIDWKMVDEYLQSCEDGASIARLLGIDPETLYRRCQQDQKIGFSDYKAQKKAEGDAMLHKKQFDVALDGNVSMLIWLGKQRLSQTDKQQTDLTTDGEKIKFNLIDGS